MRVLYLFGPNLGALGRRDPELYGKETLAELMSGVETHAAELGHQLTWRQSDHEGELVGWLLGAVPEGFEAIVVNPGALAHYAHALRDAVEACGLPVLEVHQTNVHAREPFRHTSVISPACRGVIVGLGGGGYHVALEALRWITD